MKRNIECRGFRCFFAGLFLLSLLVFANNATFFRRASADDAADQMADASHMS
jgi:hypothetical protein